MSETEVKSEIRQSKNESIKKDIDINIYSDILTDQDGIVVKLKQTVEKLCNEKNLLVKNLNALQKNYDEIIKKFENMEVKYKTVCHNSSVLFKTAQSEIKRKNQMIQELRRKNDNLVFRKTPVKRERERTHRSVTRSVTRRRYSSNENKTTDPDPPSPEDGSGSADPPNDSTHNDSKINTSDCLTAAEESITEEGQRIKGAVESNDKEEIQAISSSSNVSVPPPLQGPVTPYSRRVYKKLYGVSPQKSPCQSTLKHSDSNPSRIKSESKSDIILSTDTEENKINTSPSENLLKKEKEDEIKTEIDTKVTTISEKLQQQVKEFIKLGNKTSPPATKKLSLNNKNKEISISPNDRTLKQSVSKSMTQEPLILKCDLRNQQNTKSSKSPNSVPISETIGNILKNKKAGLYSSNNSPKINVVTNERTKTEAANNCILSDSKATLITTSAVEEDSGNIHKQLSQDGNDSKKEKPSSNNSEGNKIPNRLMANLNKKNLNKATISPVTFGKLVPSEVVVTKKDVTPKIKLKERKSPGEISLEDSRKRNFSDILSPSDISSSNELQRPRLITGDKVDKRKTLLTSLFGDSPLKPDTADIIITSTPSQDEQVERARSLSPDLPAERSGSPIFPDSSSLDSDNPEDLVIDTTACSHNTSPRVSESGRKDDIEEDKNMPISNNKELPNIELLLPSESKKNSEDDCVSPAKNDLRTASGSKNSEISTKVIASSKDVNDSINTQNDTHSKNSSIKEQQKSNLLPTFNCINNVKKGKFSLPDLSECFSLDSENRLLLEKHVLSIEMKQPFSDYVKPLTDLTSESSHSMDVLTRLVSSEILEENKNGNINLNTERPAETPTIPRFIPSPPQLTLVSAFRHSENSVFNIAEDTVGFVSALTRIRDISPIRTPDKKNKLLDTSSSDAHETESVDNKISELKETNFLGKPTLEFLKPSTSLCFQNVNSAEQKIQAEEIPQHDINESIFTPVTKPSAPSTNLKDSEPLQHESKQYSNRIDNVSTPVTKPPAPSTNLKDSESLQHESKQYSNRIDNVSPPVTKPSAPSTNLKDSEPLQHESKQYSNRIDVSTSVTKLSMPSTDLKDSELLQQESKQFSNRIDNVLNSSKNTNNPTCINVVNSNPDTKKLSTESDIKSEKVSEKTNKSHQRSPSNLQNHNFRRARPVRRIISHSKTEVQISAVCNKENIEIKTVQASSSSITVKNLTIENNSELISVECAKYEPSKKNVPLTNNGNESNNELSKKETPQKQENTALQNKMSEKKAVECTKYEHSKKNVPLTNNGNNESNNELSKKETPQKQENTALQNKMSEKKAIECTKYEPSKKNVPLTNNGNNESNNELSKKETPQKQENTALQNKMSEKKACSSMSAIVKENYIIAVDNSTISTNILSNSRHKPNLNKLSPKTTPDNNKNKIFKRSESLKMIQKCAPKINYTKFSKTERTKRKRCENLSTTNSKSNKIIYEKPDKINNLNHKNKNSSKLNTAESSAECAKSPNENSTVKVSRSADKRNSSKNYVSQVREQSLNKSHEQNVTSSTFKDVEKNTDLNVSSTTNQKSKSDNGIQPPIEKQNNVSKSAEKIVNTELEQKSHIASINQRVRVSKYQNNKESVKPVLTSKEDLKKTKNSLQKDSNKKKGFTEHKTLTSNDHDANKNTCNEASKHIQVDTKPNHKRSSSSSPIRWLMKKISTSPADKQSRSKRHVNNLSESGIKSSDDHNVKQRKSLTPEPKYKIRYNRQRRSQSSSPESGHRKHSHCRSRKSDDPYPRSKSNTYHHSRKSYNSRSLYKRSHSNHYRMRSESESPNRYYELSDSETKILSPECYRRSRSSRQYHHRRSRSRSPYRSCRRISRSRSPPRYNRNVPRKMRSSSKSPVDKRFSQNEIPVEKSSEKQIANVNTAPSYTEELEQLRKELALVKHELNKKDLKQPEDSLLQVDSSKETLVDSQHTSNKRQVEPSVDNNLQSIKRMRVMVESEMAQSNSASGNVQSVNNSTDKDFRHRECPKQDLSSQVQEQTPLLDPSKDLVKSPTINSPAHGKKPITVIKLTRRRVRKLEDSDVNVVSSFSKPNLRAASKSL